MPFARAWFETTSMELSVVSSRSKSNTSNSARPDSIFERSSTSLRMLSSDSALALIVSAYSSC